MLPRLLTVWLLVAVAGNALDTKDIGQSAADIQISHHKYQQRVAVITLQYLAHGLGSFLQTSSIIFNE